MRFPSFGHMKGRLRGLALAVALLALCALALSAWATAAAQDEGSKTITGLTLSSDSPGELEIAWNAAGQEATDYRVNWARSDEDFPSWNETEGNSYPTTNSLTLTGLDQGVQYKVQVRARYGGDGAHSGPWSGVARATVAATPEPTPDPTPESTPEPTADPTPESTPEPTADPTPDPTPDPDRHVSGLTLSSSSPGELEITWNAAGQEATDYRVNWARSDEDFPSWNETEGNSYPTTNSLTLTGLDQGVEYKVQVRARYGGDGAHSGPWSGVARATVAAEGSGSGAGNPPAAPTGLLTAATHDSVLLAWDNPDDDGVTGYRVLRRVRTEGNELKVIAPDTGSAATSYTDETVAAETAYEYQVKAINARGVSEASASANANTPAAPVLRQDEPQPETAQQQSGGDIIIVDGPGRKLVSRRFVTPGIEHYQTVDGGVPYSSRIHRDAFDSSYSSIDLIAGNRYTVHITGRDRESGEDGGTDPLRKGHLYGIFEPDNLLTPHAIRIVPASGWVDEDSDHSPTEDVVWNFVARKTGRHSIRTNGKAFECLLYDGKRHNCTYAGFYLVRVTSGADDGDRAGAVGLGEIAWMRGMEPARPFVQALARGNQIGGSDRVDYYSFSFEQRAQIVLNLTDLDIDVDLYLEDEDGKTILANIQPGSDDFELTRDLNPGRYYVRITSSANAEGVYRFTYHVERSGTQRCPRRPAGQPQGHHRVQAKPRLIRGRYGEHRHAGDDHAHRKGQHCLDRLQHGRRRHGQQRQRSPGGPVGRQKHGDRDRPERLTNRRVHGQHQPWSQRRLWLEGRRRPRRPDRGGQR